MDNFIDVSGIEHPNKMFFWSIVWTLLSGEEGGELPLALKKE